MAFALPRAEFDKLIAQLERLAKTPDDVHLQDHCIQRTHALCDMLAGGTPLETQLLKLMQAGNAERAAKLVNAFALGGAMTRRLKFSKMF